MGSGVDLHKGGADDFLTAVVPFRSSNYSAQEMVFARINLTNPTIRYIDFIAPVLNVGGHSIQGVGTFVTHIPIPSADSYVQRVVGRKSCLLPHRMMVEGKKPKNVLKGGAIGSAALNAINGDKHLTDQLAGRSGIQVEMGGLSTTSYSVSFDDSEYPGGMFYTVPFRGFTVMIARDAGAGRAKVNHPDWGFYGRFEAFHGVAKYLKTHPEVEAYDGKFYMDTPLAFLLPDLLKQLDQEAG
jgi:hypothetical protein